MFKAGASKTFEHRHVLTSNELIIPHILYTPYTLYSCITKSCCEELAHIALICAIMMSEVISAMLLIYIYIYIYIFFFFYKSQFSADLHYIYLIHIYCMHFLEMLVAVLE